jgi:hypothetical protein
MSCWCGRQGFRACWWALRVRCECGCFTGVTPVKQPHSQLCNTLKLLMMGILVPETCWASNKICNKNHLLHLVGILVLLINDDARSKSLQIYMWVIFKGVLMIVDSVHSWKLSTDILRLSVCYGPRAYQGHPMYSHWANYMDRKTDAVITSDPLENALLESNAGTIRPNQFKTGLLCSGVLISP